MALIFQHLGTQAYLSTWNTMQQWVAEALPTQDDEIWLLQHHPVFTLGQAGDRRHLLQVADIPVVHSDRGGQVTYHGPGQLVVYFLLNLQRYGLGPKALVHQAENLLIRLLAEYGIAAHADSARPGIYIALPGGIAKIASLGFRVRRGYSYHGIALNVAMDLEPFQAINPCGYAELQMTQMQAHVAQSLAVTEVAERFSGLIKTHFTEKLHGQSD